LDIVLIIVNKVSTKLANKRTPKLTALARLLTNSINTNKGNNALGVRTKVASS
jgi:hypothetical protein